MDNANNNLIPFRKCWNYKDGGYGEKEYLFNPAIEVKGIEPCKINRNGREIDCVKIFYSDPETFITLVGNMDYFKDRCRNTSIAICLLMDLKEAGLTIKQFLEQVGKLNDVNLL